MFERSYIMFYDVVKSQKVINNGVTGYIVPYSHNIIELGACMGITICSQL